MLKIARIIHPAYAALALPMQGDGTAEIRTFYPADAGALAADHAVRLPVRWTNPARQHYRGLGPALRTFGPDIIHLHAPPASLLAFQVSRIAKRLCPNGALVLECEHEATGAIPWQWRWVARRVLTAADAAVTRHLDGIGALRQLGFDGLASVTGAGTMPIPLPSRADARNALGLVEPACAVFGFAAPLTVESGLLDVLEAVAACPSELMLLVLGTGPLRDDLGDRAAALDVSHRVTFVTPADAGRLRPAQPDIRLHPEMLAALDALLVVPHAGPAAGAPIDRVIEAAQVHGVPVIASAVPGLAEIVGPGGWMTEPQDPALLCRLLQELTENPERLAGASEQARTQAARRHSAPAVAAAMRRAGLAAYTAHLQRRPLSGGRTATLLNRQADH